MTVVVAGFFAGIGIAALWPTAQERRDRADLRSIARQQRAARALRRHPERETGPEAPGPARRTTAV